MSDVQVKADAVRNAVTIDRRDLFDLVRGGIKSALEDGNVGEGIVATWYWQEATTGPSEFWAISACSTPLSPPAAVTM
ncbi:hypothetical protein [Paraburkholderia sp. DGU8]|jgi:hypothetical protein|uniref:hypothetical protein n=1 Tax=Paraburkholderia sp. DGU8 TaxID=3161997 RepID=UPI003467A4DB